MQVKEWWGKNSGYMFEKKCNTVEEKGAPGRGDKDTFGLLKELGAKACKDGEERTEE